MRNLFNRITESPEPALETSPSSTTEPITQPGEVDTDLDEDPDLPYYPDDPELEAEARKIIATIKRDKESIDKKNMGSRTN